MKVTFKVTGRLSVGIVVWFGVLMGSEVRVSMGSEIGVSMGIEVS